MAENLSNKPKDLEKLHRTLTELSQEFGMRAVVDVLVDIDNETWQKKLESAKHWMEPDSPFIVNFDKATDEL